MYHAGGLKGMEWTFELPELNRAQMSIKRSHEGDLGIARAWTRGRAVHWLCSVSCSPLPRLCISHISTTPTNKLLTDISIPMSHSYLTAAASSSNFQVILNNALNAYKERTKKDLLIHPLASQLETCSSPAAILAILHQQVRAPDQSPDRDDRWIKWLDPTVNIICTLSDGLGEGVGLVSLRT